MPTLEFTADELRIVKDAVEAYLEEFGHEEAETVRRIKSVLAKLASAL